jgi:hypothetical protein
MSDLSRRSLVTSAAALPALAVPAVAVAAAAEPDPIFAALKRFELADLAEKAGYDARNKADEAFAAKYGRAFPSGLTKEVIEEGRMDFFWFSAHERISKQKLPKALIAEMHCELNRQTDDYNATVQPVHDGADESFHERWAAQKSIFVTVPTSLAGMRAKIDFAFSVDYVTEPLTDDKEMLRTFFETLYEAAHIMAVQS